MLPLASFSTRTVSKAAMKTQFKHTPHVIKVALLILLVASMLMTSHGRRVTILNPGTNSMNEIREEGYTASEHVMRRGNDNNVNKDEKTVQHCYAQCSAACVNPSSTEVESICYNMCKDHCHF
ncbi:hypothetical protein V8G54_026195 [Vigna mungo]|uniref:Uncharacterized protein n=1 Tax=Vigna mungo TaxID=3915 RepID=A0AAQ3N0L3_VIGMU